MKQKLNQVPHSSWKIHILNKVILLKTVLIKTFCASYGRIRSLAQTEKVNWSNTNVQN